MKYCLKAKNYRQAHNLYSTNLTWKNFSLLPQSFCKRSNDDSIQFNSYLLMCRVNSQMSNYRNITTYRQKLTKDDKGTQMKQTTNAQKQDTKQTKHKKTLW